MRRQFLYLFAFLSFISCSNDDDRTTFESEGLITGADLTLCICFCGGYFIEIEDQTYRFEVDQLPANDLDLSIENLPLKVDLNWSLIEPNDDCGASDRILISSIIEAP
ncbi:hypothetical protein ABN763_05215 [Spongiivirga sp. MCCC 1A20706]|uniref:hypothetical protein n=1 Tax=Spongiivirga sp. MCCC 1A20706 TaxID=3160963 RepID=UPI003977B280